MKLKDYQRKAVEELKNGSILCGGVGSGKSLTALVYYYEKECLGHIDPYKKRRKLDRPLYIITTARKRDLFEWEKECANIGLNINEEDIIVDSWNNIKKYKDVNSAFFIFDEQRVVGSGVWVKTFLRITRRNHWILLSATPGDQWTDYIPVFVANGFYKNKTDFCNQHCIYSRFSKYPKIESYRDEETLERHRRDILVYMYDERKTERCVITVFSEYNKDVYKTIFRDRWNPYENIPIQEIAGVVYLLRKCVNSDQSRIDCLGKILRDKKKAIIFYNFNYELDMLRDYLESKKIEYGEWNGQKHENMPTGKKWCYLVQYSAGCEGWNCTTTDTIIFYSQSYSYRMTEQAAGRIDRINTPFKTLYYFHIRSRAPIDLAITKSLCEKRNFNERKFMEK